MCVGCAKPLSLDEAQHRCTFWDRGFEQDGHKFRPCGTSYHLGCIQAGAPFQTHLKAGKGLSFPCLEITPPFICECCTVQAQLNQELTREWSDIGLLMLERMRLIDQAHSWVQSTHSGYQT